jgi:5-methylthioadenosine/S-adenosylhomocysteine deaminase
MATINGAKALGLEDQIGSIEVGKKADLVVLDMEHTTTLPINDLIVDIVHNVHSNNIHMTVINGDIVYRDNMLYLPFMEMEIRDRVNSILRRLQ